jgi:6-phosphogluconolactonase
MPEIRNVTVVPGPEELAAASADHVVSVVSAALAERERVHVALGGGSTPVAMNKLLASAPRRDAVDWRRVVFWFGDERCVPPDDPASNYRMNRETLLEPLGIPAGNVHRMHGESDPSSAAADYDTVLLLELGERPQLDLILLGMGPDGHTASLFPGTIKAIDKSKLCIAHYVPQLDRWRITLTPRAINEARTIAIGISGAEKADALHAVLDGPRQPDVYPAQLVHPRHGRLYWFVDEAAAAKL